MMGSREGGGPRDQREGICCLSREEGALGGGGREKEGKKPRGEKSE